MDSEIYSEEALQAKKYGGLLKIAKAVGARTTNESGKRLKTSKLIEYILEAQSANCITENAAAVADALKDENIIGTKADEQTAKERKSQDSEPEEELLSDIQFPAECEEESPEIQGLSDRKESNEKSRNDGRSKRRRTETFELSDTEADKGNEKKETGHKRRRTGTFDVTEDAVENPTVKPKRHRTSTFEVAKEGLNGSLSDDVSQEIAEENSQQLRALVSHLSEAKNQEKIADSPSVTLKLPEKLNSSSRSSVIKKVNEKEEIPPNKSKTNVLQDFTTKPVHKTSRTPRLTERKSVSESLVKRGARESVMASGKKLPTGTPVSNKKELRTSKIMKPLFTVGRGDTPAKEETEETKQQGSNIPRFVTFARKLKVPNFAKIHERAFNRMQALDDYVDRKRHLSGLSSNSAKKTKSTPASGEIFRPAVTSVENLDLNFADAAAAESPAKTLMNINKTKSSEVIQKKQSESASELKSAKKSPKLSLGRAAVKVAGTKLKSPKVQVRKSPRTGKSNVKPVEVTRSTRKSPSFKNVSPKARYSTLPRPLKENIKPARHSIASPAPGKLNSLCNLSSTPGSVHKRKEYDPKASVNKPITYVPYKGALKPLNSADVHKAMGEKLPNIKSSKQRREVQKKILKGVRFNKRFELQMAKRGISLT